MNKKQKTIIIPLLFSLSTSINAFADITEAQFKTDLLKALASIESQSNQRPEDEDIDIINISREETSLPLIYPQYTFAPPLFVKHYITDTKFGSSYEPTLLINYSTILKNPKLHADKAELDTTSSMLSSSTTVVNTGILEQRNCTSERTQSTTESFSYSNKEAVTLGFSSSTAIEIGVDFFVAKSKVTQTFGFEFKPSYEHTSTNTTSKTVSITFPSQCMNIPPLQRGTIIQSVFPVRYSGDMVSTQVVDGSITLYKNNLRRYMFSYDIITINGTKRDTGSGWIDKQSSVPPTAETLSIYEAYSLARSMGVPIPTYISFDDTKKQIITASNIINHYEGIGSTGDHIEVQYIFEPLDGSSPPVSMSLSDYQDEEKRARLLKQQ